MHIFLIIFFLTTITSPLIAISSLPEAIDYIKTYPEDVTPDNANEFNPIFLSFYRKNTPSTFETLASFLGIPAPHKLSNIEEIKKKLHRLTKQRQLDGYWGDYLLAMRGEEGIKLVIWGDLQGSLHSLVRGLEQLKRLGIIDDSLTIISNHLIIFNSNLIGRTPYSLEILDLVASLMERNPNRVLYIRGQYEDKNFWSQYSLSRQISPYKRLSFESPDSLASIINRFFNTLPLAFYVSYRQGEQLIRISGYGRNFDKITEKHMPSFFKDIPPGKIAFYGLTKSTQKTVSSNIHVRFFFRSMDGINEFKKTKGFVFLEPQGGSSVAALFSSPTRVHKLLNNFYHDAFAIVDLGKTIEQTTLTLFNRDTRLEGQFQAQPTIFILSRGQLAHKKDSTQNIITVGSTLDLSKSVATTGKSINLGIDCCLNYHNKLLKPGHKQLRVLVLDDGYTPSKARENITYFMEKENIDIFLLPVGSPTLQASIDLMEANRILTLFPITGAPQFRTNTLPGVIHFRASYDAEVQATIEYAIKVKLVKNFTIFYQDDAYGIGPLESARRVFKANNITAWTEIPYTRNTTDFKKIVEKINEKPFDILCLFSTAASTKEMLHQLGTENLDGKYLLGISFLVSSLFEQYVHDIGVQYIFARSVPNPFTSTLPIIEEYRTSMIEYDVQYNAFSLEAYICTSLLFDALNRISGPINHNSVRSYFEQLNNYHYKGLTLTFNPETRSLGQPVWIDTNADEWFPVTGRP